MDNVKATDNGFENWKAKKIANGDWKGDPKKLDSQYAKKNIPAKSNGTR